MNASNTPTNGSGNGSLNGNANGAGLPAPLSPDTYDDTPPGNGSGTAASTAGPVSSSFDGTWTSSGTSTGDASGVLSPSDRLTLNASLNAIKQARADAFSADLGTSRSARWQILTTVSHITGFLDGKGALSGTTPNGGYLGLFQSSEPPHFDLWLNGIESALTQLLSEPPTRGFKKTLYKALGKALVGKGASDVIASVPAFFEPSI